jgi:hypothetical protein
MVRRAEGEEGEGEDEAELVALPMKRGGHLLFAC